MIERKPPAGSDLEYEPLELVDSDIIHICHIADSLERFCLVVTKETGEQRRSVCHEFEKEYVNFTFLRLCMELTEIVVLQAAGIRWNLCFRVQTDDILRGIYNSLAQEDNFEVIITIKSTRHTINYTPTRNIKS